LHRSAGTDLHAALTPFAAAALSSLGDDDDDDSTADVVDFPTTDSNCPTRPET